MFAWRALLSFFASVLLLACVLAGAQRAPWSRAKGMVILAGFATNTVAKASPTELCLEVRLPAAAQAALRSLPLSALPEGVSLPPGVDLVDLGAARAGTGQAGARPPTDQAQPAFTGPVSPAIRPDVGPGSVLAPLTSQDEDEEEGGGGYSKRRARALGDDDEDEDEDSASERRREDDEGPAGSVAPYASMLTSLTAGSACSQWDVPTVLALVTAAEGMAPGAGSAGSSAAGWAVYVVGALQAMVILTLLAAACAIGSALSYAFLYSRSTGRVAQGPGWAMSLAAACHSISTTACACLVIGWGTAHGVLLDTGNEYTRVGLQGTLGPGFILLLAALALNLVATFLYCCPCAAVKQARAGGGTRAVQGPPPLAYRATSAPGAPGAQAAAMPGRQGSPRWLGWGAWGSKGRPSQSDSSGTATPARPAAPVAGPVQADRVPTAPLALAHPPAGHPYYYYYPASYPPAPPLHAGPVYYGIQPPPHAYTGWPVQPAGVPVPGRPMHQQQQGGGHPAPAPSAPPASSKRSMEDRSHGVHGRAPEAAVAGTTRPPRPLPAAAASAPAPARAAPPVPPALPTRQAHHQSHRSTASGAVSEQGP